MDIFVSVAYPLGPETSCYLTFLNSTICGFQSLPTILPSVRKAIPMQLRSMDRISGSSLSKEAGGGRYRMLFTLSHTSNLEYRMNIPKPSVLLSLMLLVLRAHHDFTQPIQVRSAITRGLHRIRRPTEAHIINSTYLSQHLKLVIGHPVGE